jgi:hypothetical protein
MTIQTLPYSRRWDWRFTGDDPDALVNDATPTPAFLWNAWLGVGCCKRVDLVAAEPLAPVRHWAIAHRWYLQLVIGQLVARGVRQFIDVGCGAPSVGHAAQIIARTVPDARIVCVDLDPVAVAMMDHHYRHNPRVTAVVGDLRRAGSWLYDKHLLERVDFAEPVAYLAIAVLQHLTDDHPARVLAQLRAAAVAGSYLAVSHPAPVPDVPPGVAAALAGYPAPWVPRHPGAAGALLAGWSPVEGVTPLTARGPTMDAVPVPAWAVLAEAAPVDQPVHL